MGSSLLTGAVFFLVLRHRRKKRRQRGDDGAGGDMGYPQQPPTTKTYSVASSASSKRGGGDYAASDDSSSTYSNDGNTNNDRFPFPAGSAIKRPLPAATSAQTNPRGTGPERKTIASGVGYAVSYYGPRPSISASIVSATNNITTTTATKKKPPFPFQLGNPPLPRSATAAASTNAAGGKFTLFPTSTKPKTQPGEDQPAANPQATSAASSAGGGVGSTGVGRQPSSSPVGRERGQEQQGGQQQQRVGSGGSGGGLQPSLERWLRDGTVVSPFSTLVKK